MLLRKVQQEEQRNARGKLRIFFGFAPGVGKTYRMLQVARAAKAQGVDVAVGVVETHRRSETAALLDGLELLPRRLVLYHRHNLEEFDLDLALARKPAVLLVDELAHTNAPGSRHAKRWQDVLELIEAGIDVFTTVNVQHIESLNDVVAQITRVRVKETIPDSILDSADEIELVDLAPDALLQRLHDGKVYLPEQAKVAAAHFFQRGNLLSLRELALRRTAQHVDEDVQEYREQHGVADTWAAGERILVAVGPAPSSGHLIRATARMAAGLRCPWIAAYVDTSALGPENEQARQRLETHLRLVESLGGRVTRLTDSRVADSLLEYARKNNVTRIVIGKPTHSRLRDRLRGSLVDSVVRGSGDIDVHVIRGDAGEAAPRADAAPARIVAPLRAYVQAAIIVAATTSIGVTIRSMFPVPDLEILYLLAVMVAAARLGRGPAIFAAALGVAAYDVLFVPPYFRFAVADARYFLTFGMMFGVGFVISELTTRLRRQERGALAREERTAALYAFSRDLDRAPVGDVPSREREAVADVITRRASDVFAARTFVYGVDESGSLALASAFPSGAAFDPKELAVVQWCFEHGRPAGRGTDTLPGSTYTSTPLVSGGKTVGVLALELASHEPLGAEPREFLLAFARQSALALERIRLAEEARRSQVRANTEAMRSSLLSAVSHDLRTPLASITGAATSLRDDAQLPESTRGELVASICDEAERLERLVANLLDMTRLESGALVLKKDWVPVEEVVGSALTRLEARLGERPIHIDLPDDLPLVSVDPVLFEQLFVNVFENAAKYTPAGSAIDIRGRHQGAQVVIEVSDRGPGVPAGSEEHIFEKFSRGSHAGISGAGLGLAISRAIAQAHGGSMTARRRTDASGSTFSISLPVLSPPADAEAPHD